MTFSARATLLAFASFSSSMAAAQTADPSTSTIIVNAQETADAARAAVQQTPGGVDLVTSDDFADKLAVSLRDALAFSPGVYTQPRFGQEVRLSIRGSGISRGFHMRGLTLLQDGIPINLADDNGDFQELDPQVFERIEVYRGGNALRFGGSTLGGAINAVTPTGRSAPSFELRLDGGSFSTIRAKAAAGFATARGDGYIALTTDYSDGDRQHAKRDALRFNGNVSIRLSDTVETRFYATISHIDQDLPGSLSLAKALSTPTLSLPANIAGDQERDIDSIRLQNRTTINLESGQLMVGAHYNTKQLFHPTFQVIDQKSRDRGVFARLDLGGKMAGVPWQLTLGSQARFGTGRSLQFLNVAGSRGALTVRIIPHARTINSYGELRLTPVESLTLIAGGIHTSGSRKIDNILAPARSGTATFNSFAPKFGLLFEPNDTVQVYANYSRSVELPGYSELSQVPFGGLPGFTPVDPQKAWTFEVGTRGKLGIASWDVSLYRADLKDELLQFSTGPSIPASTFNADRTRHQGIEAGLDLQLMPWARLRQVYMFNDFRFRNDPTGYGDNRLPVIPKHQYRAELRLDLDRFSVTPNVEWTPEGAWVDYRNTQRTPGYALLGLNAEARVKDGLSVFLDMRNITGKKAVGDISALVAYVPDNPLTPADEGSVAFYPVERRAVYGGIRANF